MSTRPVRRSGINRAFAEHALRGRVEDQKFLVPARHNYGITYVGQDRLENFVHLREVAGWVTPVHESLLILHWRETENPRVICPGLRYPAFRPANQRSSKHPRHELAAAR